MHFWKCQMSPLHILTKWCPDPGGSTGDIPLSFTERHSYCTTLLPAKPTQRHHHHPTPYFHFSSYFYLDEWDRRNKPETVVTLCECCNLVQSYAGRRQHHMPSAPSWMLFLQPNVPVKNCYCHPPHPPLHVSFPFQNMFEINIFFFLFLCISLG